MILVYKIQCIDFDVILRKITDFCLKIIVADATELLLSHYSDAVKLIFLI